MEKNKWICWVCDGYKTLLHPTFSTMKDFNEETCPRCNGKGWNYEKEHSTNYLQEQ